MGGEFIPPPSSKNVQFVQDVIRATLDELTLEERIAFGIDARVRSTNSGEVDFLREDTGSMSQSEVAYKTHSPIARMSVMAETSSRDHSEGLKVFTSQRARSLSFTKGDVPSPISEGHITVSSKNGDSDGINFEEDADAFEYRTHLIESLREKSLAAAETTYLQNQRQRRTVYSFDATQG